MLRRPWFACENQCHRCATYRNWQPVHGFHGESPLRQICLRQGRVAAYCSWRRCACHLRRAPPACASSSSCRRDRRVRTRRCKSGWHREAHLRLERNLEHQRAMCTAGMCQRTSCDQETHATRPPKGEFFQRRTHRRGRRPVVRRHPSWVLQRGLSLSCHQTRRTRSGGREQLPASQNRGRGCSSQTSLQQIGEAERGLRRFAVLPEMDFVRTAM
ncbi:unannotated protein [freshwater metagenome]|uniref:Unannotated protein n=1 Tax=freshwater metagenome TaxID=449393 RepID=A0A6J6DGH4_9ZZZZ